MIKLNCRRTEWYTSAYDNKVKKTIGKQNADLQITNLNNNAQPFYVLLGNDERVLVSPYGYDKSAESFVKFLDERQRRNSSELDAAIVSNSLSLLSRIYEGTIRYFK